MNLKNFIAEVPNFPREGILFYDISPLLNNPSAWVFVVDEISRIVKSLAPDVLVGLESRGFFISGAVAKELSIGFSLIRKKGKLPGEVISYNYKLEYGEDTLEIKKNIIKPNQRVVILDDLLATGGSLRAASELISSQGASVVGAVCIMELTNLSGRKNINFPIHTLIKY